MGAARSAYITVDRLGAPRAAGGICATVRDLALVGQLIGNGGTRGGNQVLPRAWFDDIAAGGDPQAWSAGDFAAYLPGARYRSKWYIDDRDGRLLFGLGIHGQYLFVDAERQLVVAKVSSEELPLDRYPGCGGARVALHGADLLQQHLRVEVVAEDVHVAKERGELCRRDLPELNRLRRSDADRSPAAHGDACVP